MGLAKLWAVFDNEASQNLQLVECNRIQHRFNSEYGHISVDTNPVVKVRLEVLIVDGNLMIVPTHL
jgi:uncharacterized membrane protein